MHIPDCAGGSGGQRRRRRLAVNRLPHQIVLREGCDAASSGAVLFEVDDAVGKDLVHSPDDSHADFIITMQAHLLAVVL